MVKIIINFLKLVGFLMWLGGFILVIVGGFGLITRPVGYNKSPYFLLGGAVLIIAGVILLYFLVRKDKQKLIEIMFNDWFFGLLWPW